MALSVREQVVVDGVHKDLYIGGKWRPAAGGRTLGVEDPATSELLCEVADATPRDGTQALDAAAAAQPEWAATPPRRRGEILRRAYELLLERADDLALADILAEAGLPDGVLNVVVTSDAGGVMEPMIRDGRARKLSFTGSTGVGRKLLGQCAQNVLRTSMELGGNAPFLVFSDADLDAAVDGAMAAKIRNGGEACTAANRFLVHRSVAGAFAEKLAERIGALRTGRGTEDGVQVGPLINQRAVEKVTRLVGDATQRGATVVTGGQAVGGAGHFYQPTVLRDVPADAQLGVEEIFGPVAPITVFDDESEAVRAANDTEYGLVSYLYTTDLNRALRLSEQLEAGMIGLNAGVVPNPAAPFGGIKQSGLGREGGRVGIDEFLETKYVLVPL